MERGQLNRNGAIRHIYTLAKPTSLRENSKNILQPTIRQQRQKTFKPSKVTSWETEILNWHAFWLI